MQKYSASEHAQKILEMDGKKFRVAKEASEAEIDSERLEVECAQTEAQLEELVRQGREGGGARSGRGGDDKLAEQAVYVKGSIMKQGWFADFLLDSSLSCIAHSESISNPMPKVNLVRLWYGMCRKEWST